MHLHMMSSCTLVLKGGDRLVLLAEQVKIVSEGATNNKLFQVCKYYWKLNFPMNPHVRILVGWSVCDIFNALWIIIFYILIHIFPNKKRILLLYSLPFCSYIFIGRGFRNNL